MIKSCASITISNHTSFRANALNGNLDRPVSLVVADPVLDVRVLAMAALQDGDVPIVLVGEDRLETVAVVVGKRQLRAPRRRSMIASCTSSLWPVGGGGKRVALPLSKTLMLTLVGPSPSLCVNLPVASAFTARTAIGRAQPGARLTRAVDRGGRDGQERKPGSGRKARASKPRGGSRTRSAVGRAIAENRGAAVGLARA